MSDFEYCFYVRAQYLVIFNLFFDIKVASLPFKKIAVLITRDIEIDRSNWFYNGVCAKSQVYNILSSTATFLCLASSTFIFAQSKQNLIVAYR